VTKKNIDGMRLGYSCTIDKFKEDDFLELFKYMTKATTEESLALEYRQFKALYYALHRVRQIQGYGCFYGLKDDDGDIEEVKELWNAKLAKLNEKENPVEVLESPTELAKDKKYTIISRGQMGVCHRQMKSNR